MQPEETRTYLSDGVYAECNRGYIVLSLEDQTQIALNPEAYERLQIWWDSMKNVEMGKGKLKTWKKRDA